MSPEISMEHLSAPVDSLMAVIPAGRIALRDDRIKRKWSVEFQPFLLSRVPVTQALYSRVTNQSPSTFIGENRPVETVSWSDAVNFCNLLSDTMGLMRCYAGNSGSAEMVFDPGANGWRLPSEAEWEYACKAGTTSARYGETDEIAWYRGNSGGRTHEVGRKKPNAWGICDMLGNVWEWCSDIYDETTYGSYRVLRGGGWNDMERGCLATNRRRSHPVSFKMDDLGFRIARNAG
jgi:formylglycine-generating enzyme required for sulfatase activity